MYPWLWLWAPQFHFPWGGNVAQDIHPDTNWFSRTIPPNAGDADIERIAFSLASYGKQLGWLTEAVLAMAEASAPNSAEGQEALQRLRDLKHAIDAVKKTMPVCASRG
jgi:hypothetical protein